MGVGRLGDGRLSVENNFSEVGFGEGSHSLNLCEAELAEFGLRKMNLHDAGCNSFMNC